MCDDDRPVYWREEPWNWRDPDPPRHCYTCHYWLSYQGTVEPNGYAYVSTYSGGAPYLLHSRRQKGPCLRSAPSSLPGQRSERMGHGLFCVSGKSKSPR